jgi:hypothetical protein
VAERWAASVRRWYYYERRYTETMGRPLFRTLLVGYGEQAAERFLLLAVSVSVSTFGVLTLGRPVWHSLAGVGGWLFVTAYLVGTLAFASVYAYRNDGLLVTLVGTFILLLGYAVFIGLTFFLCVGRCPTLFERISFGVFLASGGAVAIGSTAFAVGAGSRRLRERRTT